MDKQEGRFDINELAEKWAQGILTSEERDYLEKWYAGFNEENISIPVKGHPHENALGKSILNQINKQIKKDDAVKSSDFSWGKVALAASLLLFISLGIYLVSYRLTGPQIAQHITKDINPGGNKATLTLANGQTIALGNSQTGKLASEGGLDIDQISKGQVIYQLNNAVAKANANRFLENTISTPRGGQYQVILPDGTHVWLNDASSIKFPVLFTKNERRVIITGEVYLEVAHDQNKPFIVTCENQSVKVLGTHFNINAYADETAIKTTLLQGSIVIKIDNKTALVKPGQQAEVSRETNNINLISNAGLEEAVAWKNGFFHFKKAKLPAIMKQLARWYDVDVFYNGDVPKKEFTGEIQRDVNLSEALSILKFFNVNFNLEGRKIIIKS